VIERVLALAAAYTVPADEADRLVNFSLNLFEEEWALRSDEAAQTSTKSPTARESKAAVPTQSAEGVSPEVQEAAAPARSRRSVRPPGWDDPGVRSKTWGEAAGAVDVRMNR
jgi:hypothetical protein